MSILLSFYHWLAGEDKPPTYPVHFKASALTQWFQQSLEVVSHRWQACGLWDLGAPSLSPWVLPVLRASWLAVWLADCCQNPAQLLRLAGLHLDFYWLHTPESSSSCHLRLWASRDLWDLRTPKHQALLLPALLWHWLAGSVPCVGSGGHLRVDLVLESQTGREQALSHRFPPHLTGPAG